MVLQLKTVLYAYARYILIFFKFKFCNKQNTEPMFKNVTAFLQLFNLTAILSALAN